MDYSFQLRWRSLLNHLGKQFGFGEDMDLQAVLFLIGVQELGQGYRRFKKDDKVNLMHIALCTLLEPYGYYEFEGRDEDGWPHFKALDKLPPLDAIQQERLVKEAAIDYFVENGVVKEL